MVDENVATAHTSKKTTLHAFMGYCLALRQP